MVADVVDGALLGRAHPVLISAKVCSIGLRSGEYGGRYQSRTPAALIKLRRAADLWLPTAPPACRTYERRLPRSNPTYGEIRTDLSKNDLPTAPSPAAVTKAASEQAQDK